MIKKTRLTREGSRIGRQIWLDTARRMLIDVGVERVRIERIADKLGVTRGGFYWHFKDRKALLAELLHDWDKTNTEAFIAAIEEAPANFESRILRQLINRLHRHPTVIQIDVRSHDWSQSLADTPMSGMFSNEPS